MVYETLKYDKVIQLYEGQTQHKINRFLMPGTEVKFNHNTPP